MQSNKLKNQNSAYDREDIIMPSDINRYARCSKIGIYVGAMYGR